MEKNSFEKRKKVVNDLIHDKLYVPMKIKEMAILLDVSKEDRPELKNILDELIMEGKISLSKKGRYLAQGNVLTGRFQCTQRGFGFVIIEDEENDIFISEKDANGAFNNDSVEVVITNDSKEGKRREGKIVKIIERANSNMVGTYDKSANYGFVIPDNQKFSRDIFIAGKNSLGAVSGHKVVVHVLDFGEEGRNPEGEIVKIIGHINDPGTDIMSIVEGYEIPMEFPIEVMDQIENLPDEINQADTEGRLDCRSWQTVTIDGEDAKDLDDAITLTEENGIYKLGVHIADVSHYVTEKSPLDVEALKRGTSVYLVDRVIPMLPHKLSNGICSLNQQTDRLALSCIMDINDKGEIIDHKICETVINVDRRMSYTAVNKVITDKDEETTNEYSELVPMFFRMEKLAAILRKKRHKRGSIDFEFPESKIILNDKGVPIDIKEYDRNAATKLIEEFMLIANETVAEDYFWQEIPFLYRTHDNPDPEKIQTLGTFINNFGFAIKVTNDSIHPKELQKLLEKIEGTSQEALISRLTLRSMKRAQYTVESTGHFGLAAKYYTHFTSPIRRYPDLQIHRIIKENLHGTLSEKKKDHFAKILPEVAKQTSQMERRADDAERDVEKLKKTEYMKQHIGEEFEGVVSGITSWGIFVELPNTIEGMVRVSDIPGDYYIYDAEHYEMVGETTHITYKLGQKLKLKCVGADTIQKNIDFKIVS